MGYKVISIPDELYKKLVSLKKDKKSFADVIRTLLKERTEKKKELKDFFGAWKMTDEEEKKMWKTLKKMWGRKHEVPGF